jgi:hypothetical protein
VELLNEELVDWQVKDKKLYKFGQHLEELNKEFCLLDMSLVSGPYDTVPNIYRAKSLLGKFKRLTENVCSIGLDDPFDQLVATNYVSSIFAQQEYIKFFFSQKYNKEIGIRSFMDVLFLSNDGSEEGLNKGAVAFLEDKLRNVNYKKITERENLMQDIFLHYVPTTPSGIEGMVAEQLPRLREMISDYNKEMGFETNDQLNIQKEIITEHDAQRLQQSINNIFGKPGTKDSMIKIANRRLDSLDPKQVSDINALLYDLVFSYEDVASYDWGTRTMEVNLDRFYFYNDLKTGEVKFFSADLDKTVGHENFHRLQGYFSKSMPPALKFYDGEYNPNGRIMIEGIPLFLENNSFLPWMNKNKERLDLSDKDLKICSLGDEQHFANRVMRLCHAIYHRELMVEGGNDYDAHVRLAKVSKNPVLLDDEYLPDEKMSDVLYYAFYLFGEHYVKKTLNQLEDMETKRCGSKNKAKEFLNRNEPLVVQGLLTGNWGWETQGKFFLEHYWPRARQLCK